MTTRPAMDSYLIRIYQVDTKDPGNIAGVLEPIKNGGAREAFKSITELGALLARPAGTRRKKRDARSAPAGQPGPCGCQPAV